MNYFKEELAQAFIWLLTVIVIMGGFYAIVSNTNHRKYEQTKIEVLKKL